MNGGIDPSSDPWSCSSAKRCQACAIALKLAGEAAGRPVPGVEQVAALAPPIDLGRCAALVARPGYRLYEDYYVRDLVAVSPYVTERKGKRVVPARGREAAFSAPSPPPPPAAPPPHAGFLLASRASTRRGVSTRCPRGSGGADAGIN